jgi:hypothetical integral membrane protein (TIGR02206 family)
VTDARFEAYGPSHWAVLAVFVVGLGLVVWWGRRHRGDPVEDRTGKAVAALLAVVALAMQAYQLTPGDFDVDTSLPLALSDLVLYATAWSLWTRNPWTSAFTYYVGLTLTVMAVVTPALAEGFPHPRFFGFWALHLVVVWAAVWLTWGVGLRPTWRGYAVSVAVTATWAVATYAFNVVADTNYGYLNRKPGTASALDLLGPWPWYVFAEVVILLAFWAAVMTWPWTRAAARRSGTSVPAPPTGRG